MIKVLMGLAAAIIVAAGGFFGFGFYTQHRIAGEIDAAFEQIRATGGKASHGKVSFDLWSRTLEVADIAAESVAQPPLSIKIAGLKAVGVRQPDATHLAADTIEATDVDVGASPIAPAILRITYKLPHVAMKDYSGPASLPSVPAAASAIDIYRRVIEQFAALAISSVTAPSVAVTVDGGAPMSAGYVYSGLTLQDIKGGKIASVKVDRVAITASMQQAAKPQKYTGEMANLVAYDFDANAIATILDPAKAQDDRYYRVYRQMSVGAYTVNFDQGPQIRVEGATIDDAAVRPSKLQLATLMSIIQASGKVAVMPSAQALEIITNAASIYEGIRIGNADIRGMSMETPQDSGKLAAIRMNLENGKLGELAIEGLDTPSPKGPVKIGRFALKSLDLANLLRSIALFSNPAQRPSPDQLAGLPPLLGGVDVKGFAAPYKNTGRLITIDDFSLNGGQFVGPIPSQLRLTAKMASPLDTSDLASKPLLDSGLDTLVADCDVSAAWTETDHAFVLDAPALDIDGILKASARVSLGNVPRQLFTPNPQQAAAVAAQIEAGAIEVTLRDAGGVDMLITEYARVQNVSTEAARQALVDSIRSHSENVTTANPDAAAVVDALVHLFQSPKSALTIKLTPRGKTLALPLIQAMQTDPAATLAQFQIDVSTMQ